MENKISIANRQVIINYNKAYPKNRETLLKSKSFRRFLQYFIKLDKINEPELYDFLTNDGEWDDKEAAEKLARFLRMLAIFEVDELRDEYYMQDRERLSKSIETIYRDWRSLQRFGFMNSLNTPDFGINTLVARDSDMNDLLLRTYRLFEEKVNGRQNLVYRQVQAGTNACFSVHRPLKPFSEDFKALEHIPIIDCVMLRTPMILHPKVSKRTGVFTETKNNPMNYLNLGKEDWFCLPIKVGTLLCLVYFSTRYISTALSLANLFELADIHEAEKHPELMLIFGNHDDRNATEYFYDENNNIWIGCISDHPRMEYFGYFKKMILTLYNLAQMERGRLPIHGAMVNVTLKDGRKKGIMLMGDSGAGKSESIEALKHVGQDLIREVEVVFDDMGTIHLENGVPYGQGTEIGAFIRLDDLDPGTPYRDMDRSVFFSPENPNSRMVVPMSSYSFITKNHPIDFFAYANNYTQKKGISELDTEELKETCKLGQRMALGTTQEVGLSTTYFANPFGPMQNQEVCEPLIDEVFTALKENGVFTGEIYTHLGFDKNNREGIEDAARAMLEFLMGEDQLEAIQKEVPAEEEVTVIL